MNIRFDYFCAFILLFIFFSGKQLNAQSSNQPVKGQDTISDFPKDWFGSWTGDLMIYDSSGLNSKIRMSLEISKTDSIGKYNWVIIYGQDSTVQKRNYQLIEIDRVNGHFIIDEKNGILLDSYFMNNELNSVFEVMGNTLLICYEFEKNHILYSAKLFPSHEIKTSGGKRNENQSIPEVKSFKLKSSQNAKLYKKCLVE